MEFELRCEAYAGVLRSIGQDLSHLLPECMEIETAGENFIARGVVKNQQQRAARTIWQRLTQRSHKAQVSDSTFLRTYTPEDIKRLDLIGRGRRKRLIERPDLHSLQEKLRMIGEILDEKDAVLVKLCLDGNTVTVEYRGKAGEVHSEDYSVMALDQLQQRYYSEREPTVPDVWQQTRARG